MYPVHRSRAIAGTYSTHERYEIICKGKGRPVTCHEGTRGGRGMAVLVLNLGASSGWAVDATARPLYHRERAPIPIVQEAEWDLGT
jgi:hypothetical protein